jgi:drug/metabolite transporter (DMT)-like permease
MSTVLLLLFISVLLNSLGQLFFKLGTGDLELTVAGVTSVITSKYLVAGITVYGVSLVLYLVALSKADLSYAYPIISLTYVFVTLLSYFVLQEHVGVYGWIGVLFVVIGVALIGIGK